MHKPVCLGFRVSSDFYMVIEKKHCKKRKEQHGIDTSNDSAAYRDFSTIPPSHTLDKPKPYNPTPSPGKIGRQRKRQGQG